MNGLGGKPPCLLLLSAPLSHVAAVMSSQKGLAESQKLHNRALKPAGCRASPPFSDSLFFLVLSPQLLISSCWGISSTNNFFLSCILFMAIIHTSHPSCVMMKRPCFSIKCYSERLADVVLSIDQNHQSIITGLNYLHSQSHRSSLFTTITNTSLVYQSVSHTPSCILP